MLVFIQPTTVDNEPDNEATNKIIAQIIFPIFTYCCLNNLSEKRVNTSATQNKVVLKVMIHTPFVILLIQ